MKFFFLSLFALAIQAKPLEILFPKSAPKAAVLMVHGLNNTTFVMKDLAELFNSEDVLVYQIGLTGHQDEDQAQRYKKLESVKAHDWKEDILGPLKKLKKDHPKLPLYFAGYSTGGLLGALLQAEGHIELEKMLLFEPALKLNGLTHLIRTLSFFPSLSLESFAPEKYRANKNMPMSAYNTFFDVYNEFNELKSYDKLNIPTALFIDKSDELVSFKRTKKFLENEKLSQWQIFEVKKSRDAKEKYKHLATDERSMGKEAWELTRSRISAFLK